MSEESKNILLEEITREHCDSDEELWFAWYLQELKDAGIILQAELNKKAIPLSPKIEHRYELIQKKGTKSMLQHLLSSHEYTPDFNIMFNMQYRDSFYALLIQGKKFPKQNVPFITFGPEDHSSIVEVKSSYDMHGKTYLARMNIKWVFEKHLMFIQIVKVPDIFESTFTPQKYIDMMKRKRDNRTKGVKVGDSRIKWKVKTIDEYMKELDAINNKFKSIRSQHKIVDINQDKN